MQTRHTFSMLGAAAMLAAFGGASVAQRTTNPPTNPPVQRTHRMGGFFGRNRNPMMGHGQIIGNKNTKVYHLPGDTGNMPAEKNRVYFSTEQQAAAAGYHSAGQRRTARTGTSHMNGNTGRFPMGHRSHLPANNTRMNGNRTPTPPTGGGGTSR